MSFVEAGIYQKVKDTHMRMQWTVSRFRYTKTNPEYGRFVTSFSFASNISSVFIVFGSAMLIAAVVVFIEAIPVICRNLERILKKVVISYRIFVIV